MSDEDMKAELERLRSENAALKKGASDGIRMKVSEKGAVSVYGMGRFPVTLYKEQWLKLLNMSEEIRAFIAENESRLKAKEGFRAALMFARAVRLFDNPIPEANEALVTNPLNLLQRQG